MENDFLQSEASADSTQICLEQIYRAPILSSNWLSTSLMPIYAKCLLFYGSCANVSPPGKALAKL